MEEYLRKVSDEYARSGWGRLWSAVGSGGGEDAGALEDSVDLSLCGGRSGGLVFVLFTFAHRYGGIVHRFTGGYGRS